MNRRNFLGFLGIGAAAGPAAINNALAEAPKGLGGMLNSVDAPIGISHYAGSNIGNSSQYQKDRMGRLSRIISGKFSKEEQTDRRVDQLRRLDRVAWQHVQSLRSVSPVAKMMIYNNENTRLSDIVQKEIAIAELPMLKRIIKNEIMGDEVKPRITAGYVKGR